MLRSIPLVFLYSCYSLLNLPCLAQETGDGATAVPPQYAGATVSIEDRKGIAGNRGSAHFDQPNAGPCPGTKTLRRAMDAWQKQKPDEAQPKFDQALKIYPGSQRVWLERIRASLAAELAVGGGESSGGDS